MNGSRERRCASRIPLRMTREPLSPLMTSMAKRMGRMITLANDEGCSPRGSVFGLDSFNPGVEPAVLAYVVRHFRLLAVRAQRESRRLELEVRSAFVAPCAGYSPFRESHCSSCGWSWFFFCLR